MILDQYPKMMASTNVKPGMRLIIAVATVAETYANPAYPTICVKNLKTTYFDDNNKKES